MTLLTNRGAGAGAWAFYDRVRPNFAEWNHVVLTFVEDPDRTRPPLENNPAESKIVQFVDDRGDVLEIEGINLGYDGETPEKLRSLLEKEGFDETVIRAAVLNRRRSEYYPQTIARD